MAKQEQKKNKRILSILITLGLMIAIFFILIFATSKGLDIYTKHNESVAVPKIKGLQESEAATILRSNNLDYEIIDSLYRADAEPGAIIEQAPKEGSKVKRNRTIYLTIQAKGKQMISVPNLKDFSRRQAEAHLQGLGFTNISIIEESSQFKGIVIRVMYRGKEIQPGTAIPRGSKIELVVGSGGGSSELDLEDSTDQYKSIPPVDESFF